MRFKLSTSRDPFSCQGKICNSVMEAWDVAKDAGTHLRARYVTSCLLVGLDNPS